MIVDYGFIKKYIKDRGFGFVQSVFNDKSSIFFHIKEIRKSNEILAMEIEQSEPEKSLYLWFEIANNNKGSYLKKVIGEEVASEIISHNKVYYTNRVEVLWKIFDNNIPDWLRDISVLVLGECRVNDLVTQRCKVNRLSLENEIFDFECHKNNISLIEQAWEESSYSDYDSEFFDFDYNLSNISDNFSLIEKEFQDLVSEMKPLNFIYSYQVSEYIKKNKLGNKYPNISGHLKMTKDGDAWTMEGGIDPKIYARLCKALGLTDKGSNSYALGFTPYKYIK